MQAVISDHLGRQDRIVVIDDRVGLAVNRKDIPMVAGTYANGIGGLAFVPGAHVDAVGRLRIDGVHHDHAIDRRGTVDGAVLVRIVYEHYHAERRLVIGYGYPPYVID